MILRPYAKLASTVLLGAAVVLGGCAKKKTAPPPPPPPPPPAPTAKLTATPTTINAGQSVQLSWTTSNADTVNIEGIGEVSTTGSQAVTPTQSTSYHLVAKGAGGTADDTVRVTVNEPPPVQQQAAPEPTVSDEQLLAQRVPDAFFDYDSYQLRPDDQSKLQQAAQFLNQQKPGWKLVIEGHADERGSTEYNLALGDNRANSAKQALVQAGVSADRIQTMSFGKEKPFCTESTEACWQQNRRDHFRLQGGSR